MLSLLCTWATLSFIAGPFFGRWITSGWQMLERDWLEAIRSGQ